MLSGLINYGQNDNAPWYLNSKQVDLEKIYINPMRLDSIYVEKKTPFRGIYMYTKDRDFSYYRLTDILEKFTDISGLNGSILFKINDELINDTTSIKIDDTYFIYVTIEKLNSVKYIPNQFQDLTIVNINLERNERESQILFRGNIDILDKINK
jgi:hypothetical protein